MNGYVRAAMTIPYGYIKLGILKLFHMRNLKFGNLPRISMGTEISIDNGAKLIFGKRINMRGSARIRVRKSAQCIIGDRTSININNMIACHEKIEIGNDVQTGPNVQIYDHDHDFRTEGGVKAGKYKVGQIKIGNNVWIGANAVILRGTTIGDNCVIGAGTVLRGGVYPANSLIYQDTGVIVKEIHPCIEKH